VTTGGAGRRAMERAMHRVHGRPESVAFRMDGMTDRSIVRKALLAIGVEPSSEAIDRVISAYVDALHHEVQLASDADYRVHTGMREAIAATSASKAAVGLGTGNVREGARVKLERVGLHGAFRFGGFGCDAEVRSDLIRIGAERGAAELGVPLAECRVVVIGDTPKDVAAARDIGAECIGVGTGRYSCEELLASGATAAFGDLSAPGALDALLGH
jgi:phosphoglycolate phosphatase-like HAD superfamily hydrolase